MLKSEQRRDAAVADQVSFWNEWNAESRELSVGTVSLEQASIIFRWLQDLGRTDLEIIDVGCGTGWLSSELTRFGRVTATDLSDQVLARASQRFPAVKFVAGDFFALELGTKAYDVAISVEVLSHVADQPAFLTRIASLLRPNGYLLLATQNRPQLERNDIPPPKPGQIRQWVDRYELTKLLSQEFEIVEMLSATPQFNRGPLRVLNSHKLNSQSSVWVECADGLRGHRKKLGWVGHSWPWHANAADQSRGPKAETADKRLFDGV